MDQLEGIWRLVDSRAREEGRDRLSAPYGAHPIGQLTFSRGRMLAALCNGDPEPVPRGGRGFSSYGGPYTFDGTTLVTHVDMASDTTRIGGQQVRTVVAMGEHQMLMRPPARLYPAGTRESRELVWERVWQPSEQAVEGPSAQQGRDTPQPHTRRRSAIRKALAPVLMALGLSAPGAFAQQPAAMPAVIKLIVPFAPGGSTDVVARVVATQLGKRLGTSVIVDNRAGGGSLIGAAAVTKGPTDGSMLLLTTGSLATSAATNPAVPFDMKKDLLPVALIGDSPMVVAVSAKTSIRTPADLVAAARARPDMLTNGSAGVGTIGHLSAELFNDAAKVQIKHIPYKGTSLALIDLVSGTIDMTFGIYTSLAAQIQAGQVRLVAVTSKQANPAFPGVQPLSAAVPGFDATTWIAVFGPHGTPAALVQRLNREINEIAKSKEVADQMRADGGSPQSLTPEQTGRLVNDSYDLWKRVAIAKKIVVQ